MSDKDKGVVAGRVPGPIGLKFASSEWDKIHLCKNPIRRKLKCCFFWTSNATKNNAPAYVIEANKLLQEHNLVLDVCPGVNKMPERTISFNEMVNTSNELELRNLVHKNHYHEGRIPVIFCRFTGVMGADSDTNGYVVRLENWLLFILINVDNNSADGVTLLHEIGHVANCGHEKSTSDDAFPNFMSYQPPNRAEILRNQVIKLAMVYLQVILKVPE